MKLTTKTVFKCADGKECDTEADAYAHEFEIALKDALLIDDGGDNSRINGFIELVVRYEDIIIECRNKVKNSIRAAIAKGANE